MAVVAVLATLAVPSMRSALRSAAVRSATFELLAGLQQARARAVTASRPGVFCLSDLAGRCLAGNGPAQAWSASLQLESGEQALAGGPLPRDIELRATRARLSFSADALAASTGTLTICDRQGIATPRAIVLSQGGRVRLADASRESCDA